MTRIFFFDDDDSKNETPGAARELDQMRMEFFTDLSHKLRTPLTAMTLAVEGLYSHFHSEMSPSQRELAQVSRRNIERIVKLVENQLDLLQVMVGESRISRRLVDLNQLVRSIPARLDDGVQSPATVSFEVGSYGQKNEPMYVFTDPAPLVTVIDCFMGGGPANTNRKLALSFDPAGRRYRLDIDLEYLGVERDEEGAEATGEEGALPALDFECRAYSCLLEQIGGEVIMKKDADRKRIRIFLPRFPEFDRQKDFLNPIRVLHAAAEEDGVDVSFIRCDLGDEIAIDYLDADDHESRDFITRLESMISEGDAVLRGRQRRTLYLALTGRTQRELDHVKSFLDERECDHQKGKDLTLSKTQTFIQDYNEVAELMKDLELV